MSRRIFNSVILFVCFISFTTTANGQVTDGLVAHYPLDGDAQDLSGNNNHGTVNGEIAPTEDRFGNANGALFFDRINDYIQLDLSNGENKTNTEAGGVNTVIFWTYIEASSNSPVAILFTWPKYVLQIASSRGFGFNTWNDDTFGISTTEFQQFESQWIHVAAIFHNGNIQDNKIYINGVNKQPVNQLHGSPIINNAYAANSARIGNIFPSSGFSANYKFEGKMDDLYIFNRELSESEIAQIYSDHNLAHWNFNTGYGDTLFDISGNDNNGTISGATWVNGYNGSALSFDGVDDMVEIPHNSQQNASSAITIEAIIKLNGAQKAGWIPIVAKNSPGSSSGYTLFIKQDNKIEASIGGTNRWISSETSLTIGEWHLVVVQFDGSKNRIYIYNELRIGNELDVETNNSGTIQSSSYKMEIGGGTSSGRGTFNGDIDKIRISSVALQPSEFLPFRPSSVNVKDINIAHNFSLFTNYPNPFNPETKITYQIEKPAQQVRLRIFSITGELVRTLIESNQQAGFHETVWDGKTDNGKKVASGQYLYRLEVDGKNLTKKALLIR